MTAKQLTGLYPGTFDPVTLGHLDIVKRAVKLVDHLVIGVATGTDKAPLFSLEERVEMWRHEAGDHAMERHAVIKALAGQLLDPGNMVGRDIRFQRDHHRPVLELQDQGILGIARHYFCSLQR
jgi:cytidyltransferase-like protein